MRPGRRPGSGALAASVPARSVRSEPPWPALDAAGILAALLFAVWRFVRLHRVIGPAVSPGLPNLRGAPLGGDAGWWLWWDQSFYIKDAVAWSHGLTDPALHWCLPAYPMLGSLFVGVTGGDPFFLPDLACFAASLLLCARLGARLLDDRRCAGAAAAWIFVATTVLPFDALWSWVVPWTTSLSSAGLFAALWATSRLLDGDFERRYASIAACSVVTVAACRPAEGAVILGVAVPVAVWAAIGRPTPRAVLVRAALAAGAGACLPAAIFGGAYWLVWGFRASPYLVLSQSLGFEWRLLPLHWVTLMIDPKPLFSGGAGLAQRFVWLVPGLAGMVAAQVAPGHGRRPLHGLVAGAVLLDCASFLSYRDLHPPALWRFGLFHYFTWTLPIFGLFAARLLALAFEAVRVRRSRLAVAAGLAAALALFCWRVRIGPLTVLPVTAPAAIALPRGLSAIDDVLFARDRGDWDALWGGGNWIDTVSSKYQSFYSFKVYQGGDELMVLPLRPMLHEPSVLHFAPGTVLDAAAGASVAQLTAVWGLPCWIAPQRRVCRPYFGSPASVAPPATALGFGIGGDAAPFLAGGWSVAEPSGRWTDEAVANLRFGLPRAGGAELELVASGLVGTGQGRTHVVVFANGRHVADWHLGRDRAMQRAFIPAAAVPADRSVLVTFEIVNPRRRTARGGADARLLGLCAATMRVVQSGNGAPGGIAARPGALPPNPAKG